MVNIGTLLKKILELIKEPQSLFYRPTVTVSVGSIAAGSVKTDQTLNLSYPGYYPLGITGYNLNNSWGVLRKASIRKAFNTHEGAVAW